ncbi:L-fucose/L-arabinose isomerase family protein [Paenactinomyces guangxiensis]|uniref:L-fucose isomerase C-terminal domain-containing protein n=1 Tax=Paenactinomyces guangxiensis TaxID=1490290 RepID=A0A7W1WP24_9BACL|nr:hypothetical protein [Paenactinomyces guangxiensis]MBA4493449.1 hypothetical protein [Paenactinomyces guangxiensis]MBH8590540.1 hypothetical protein [Paenactinomyces guangxiensis]
MVTTSVLYLPIGRKTFDLQVGQNIFEQSAVWLKETCATVCHPDGILTSVEELETFLESVETKEIDTIVYQSVTFADGEFIAKVIESMDQPVIVWSVREPSVGGRLRLNSLTGGNSTSHVLRDRKHPFSFVFGNPDEDKLQTLLKQQIQVNRLIWSLKRLTIGVVGEHPAGFFFSDVNEEQLQSALGVKILPIDLYQAFEAAKKLPEEEWKPVIHQAEQQVVGLNRSDETVKRFAQFTTYLQKYIGEHQIGGVAIRCWPDFFIELGAAACSTLSHLTEGGVVSSCESDIHGSISMYILRELSGGKAPYLGDLVHIDEAKNSVVFWHCGAGAYSLAHPETGATAGVHPNRKMGLTMDFGLKAGKVTIFRLSYSQQGYRLLVMKGEALDSPQAFDGTSVEVKLTNHAEETLYRLMKEGFEPHYALVYDDIADLLVKFGKQVGIETVVL